MTEARRAVRARAPRCSCKRRVAAPADDCRRTVCPTGERSECGLSPQLCAGSQLSRWRDCGRTSARL